MREGRLKTRGYVYAGVYPEIEKGVVLSDPKEAPIRIRHRKVRREEKAAEDLKDPKQLSRRGNERRIAQAVECVYRWKYLQQSNGAKKGMTQHEAATRVGVPKKTLDEYLKQIKLGKQNNFDFNYYRNSLIGLLRNYNKERAGSVTPSI